MEDRGGEHRGGVTVTDAFDEVIESADLLYHLFVLWAACGIVPADVAAELARREGTSGLDEKRNRKK